MIAGGGSKCAADGAEDRRVAQRRQPGRCAKRDVRRTTGVVGDSARVGCRSAAGGGLTPGADTATAPRPGNELELSRVAFHLDCSRYYNKLAGM
jgi:hypothetical protein